MSRRVATLVYSRCIGSMTKKAVLAYMADRANDDGSGIWASKQRIADEIECSKQTVITTIQALMEAGLIEDAGRRPCTNGHTIIYNINVAAVSALPEIRRSGEQEAQIKTGPNLDGSNSLTSRGQGDGPKPSLNRPTPKEANASSAPKGARKRGERIPDGWSVPSASELPPQAQRMAKQWPDGAYEVEAEAFHGYWLSEGRAGARKVDWNRAWANRVIQITPHILRSAKAGVAYAAPVAVSFEERARMMESTAVMFDRMGRSDDAAESRKAAARIRGTAQGKPIGDIASKLLDAAWSPP